MDPGSAFIAAYHVGDPMDPFDAWRPFLRKRRLEKRLDRLQRQLSSPQAAIDVEIDN